MDKKDLIYGGIAVVIILILALFIKPVATGHPVNIGLSFPAQQQTPVPVMTAVQRDSNLTAVVSPSPRPTTPTPVPTWNKNVTSVAFVNSSVYGIPPEQPLTGGTRIDEIPRNTSMTAYATITGKYSGTTQVIRIPFPYWEIWYSVEPAGKTGGKEQQLRTSTVTGPKESGIKGSGSSQTVIQGSFSVIYPLFSLQVMDADDPNRIVRTITPPGGLDSTLWTGEAGDPRPWKEKFFEGQRNYYFIINSHSLSAYKIEIRIPTTYIGKY